MLSVKQASKLSSRTLLSPLLLLNSTTTITISPSPSSISTSLYCYYDYCHDSACNCHQYSTATATAAATNLDLSSANNPNSKQVALSFKEWFKTTANKLKAANSIFDQIYEILDAHEDKEAIAVSLSQLNLRLNEAFVLDVLDHGKKRNNEDRTYSCLKFFDWAWEFGGFFHTRATYYAIFKILATSRHMRVLLDYLDGHGEMTRKNMYFYPNKVGFYATLVMGYAVAGKINVALHLFGKMRFMGLDLNELSYHVLLNALVEQGWFDAFEVIRNQIFLRGLQNEITHTLTVKSLCRRKRLDEAEVYLWSLLGNHSDSNNNGNGCNYGHAVRLLVDGFCGKKEFDRAGKLIEEFSELGVGNMEIAYGLWLRNLIETGNIDGALEFLKRKRSLLGYVPGAFRYNSLLFKLLKKARLQEACDLLVEMKESGIIPDKVTMNLALCFFCKAGMMDVALHLGNSCPEFGFSPNTMAYNFLVNTLCGNGNVDEAYHLLANCTEKGYFPGRKAFSIVVDALCRERKLDRMVQLIMFALARNIWPSQSRYDKYISALCRARRVEDGYLIYGELNRMNKVATTATYSTLIHSFNKLNRGDIAARLLIEMQDGGHKAARSLFRGVIQCLCNAQNPETQFFKLLEMQFSHHEPNCETYNCFIDGAGHAKKPELAIEVFAMMQRNGIVPTNKTYILMLKSYLKSERVSDAINLFNALRPTELIGKKTYNFMIVGLYKINKPDTAFQFFKEMRVNGLVPSYECYEVLIQSFCSREKYDVAVNIINDMEKVGRHITTFIGNICLLHSLRGEELYEAWKQSRGLQTETPSQYSMLGQLIGIFSGRIRVLQPVENLEELIEQCFSLDIFTYNMLIRRLSMNKMDHACELLNRACQKGYEPNRWTYDILTRGFFKHGRKDEAVRWAEEMIRKGFDMTERTIELVGREKKFVGEVPGAWFQSRRQRSF